MGVPAPYRQLCVFAVNLLSPVRASTRPLLQPARQNSKARIPFPSYRSNSCFPSAPAARALPYPAHKDKAQNLHGLGAFMVNFWLPSAPEPVHSRARLAKNKTKNLGALRVFVVNKSLKYHHLRTTAYKFPRKIFPKYFPNWSLNIAPCASTMHSYGSGKKPDGHGIGLHALALAPPAPVHGGPAG